MKAVLITGASSGFGYETAKLLAENGYNLVLVARRKDKLDALKKELKTKVYTAQVDVQNKNEVEAFFKELPANFKDIDVLINNAGLALGLTTADQSNLEDWENMIATNINGLLYFTRFALDEFKKKNSGLIINIGSVAAHAPYKGGNVYGATKAFVKQFSRNLRADLFGTDIKVTNIEPGMAETEFSKVRFNGDKTKADDVYKNTRALTAKDIADTILSIITRPTHVNIDNLEIMPLDQSWAGMVINRNEQK